MLPSTTGLIARLRNQFVHVFTELILCLNVLKALIITKLGLKWSYFCKENCKISERWTLRPQIHEIAPSLQIFGKRRN